MSHRRENKILRSGFITHERTYGLECSERRYRPYYSWQSIYGLRLVLKRQQIKRKKIIRIHYRF